MVFFLVSFRCKKEIMMNISFDILKDKIVSSRYLMQYHSYRSESQHIESWCCHYQLWSHQPLTIIPCKYTVLNLIHLHDTASSSIKLTWYNMVSAGAIFIGPLKPLDIKNIITVFTPDTTSELYYFLGDKRWRNLHSVWDRGLGVCNKFYRNWPARIYTPRLLQDNNRLLYTTIKVRKLLYSGKAITHSNILFSKEAAL